MKWGMQISSISSKAKWIVSDMQQYMINSSRLLNVQQKWEKCFRMVITKQKMLVIVNPAGTQNEKAPTCLQHP
jgi:hypothetical protein